MNGLDLVAPLKHTEAGWFLAQIKPNCVAIAQRNLTRQNFQTFLPVQEATRRQRGRFVSALAPLFPGYIFVACDPAAGHCRAISATQGITRLVSFGAAPAPVPDAIVTQLMLRCDANGRLLPPQRLAPGDRVRLTRGPFADFVAEVETITPDRRVWVLLDLMGGATRVALRPDQLAALPR